MLCYLSFGRTSTESSPTVPAVARPRSQPINGAPPTPPPPKNSEQGTRPRDGDADEVPRGDALVPEAAGEQRFWGHARHEHADVGGARPA